MPITVKRDVKVADLRKDDVFADTHDVVLDIDRKVVWAHVRVACADSDTVDTRRLPLEGIVAVLRSENTDEEKEALRREYMAGTLRDAFKKWLSHTPVDELLPLIEKFNKNGFPDVLTHWNLGDIIQTQAMYKQAVRIRRAIHDTTDYDINSPADIANVPDDTIIDAFASWYWEYVYQHQHGYRFGPSINPLSRSTSTLSNLFEDMDVWAVQSVSATIVMAGAQDELRARVLLALDAEAEAKAKKNSSH